MSFDTAFDAFKHQDDLQGNGDTEETRERAACLALLESNGAGSAQSLRIALALFGGFYNPPCNNLINNFGLAFVTERFANLVKCLAHETRSRVIENGLFFNEGYNRRHDARLRRQAN